jgi:glycoside hydrolase family alpha-glucosidase
MNGLTKLFFTLETFSFPLMASAFSVDRIDPPHWWTGMRDTTLQLQVHGNDVKGADFSVEYPGVSIDSVVRLDGSPNWQFVYLNISPETKPGKMTLKWKEGKKTVKKEYELKARRPQKGAQGFTSADVLYLIMPDRFADGDPSNNVVKTMRNQSEVNREDPNMRHGGDMAGIMKHLDYIDSLGVTAVWVNPVLENDMPGKGGSYHGYATTDYYAIDPRFGSNAEYTELIDSLHNRGIKTVMDMIFNHSGIGHPWIEDRPASDWLNFPDDYHQTNYRLSTLTDPYASDYDKSISVDGWFVEEMPDLNQKNPHLMKYLVQNSIWWIEESQIDGIRMDTYPYADERAMAGWIDAVMKEYPDFNIVGECWFGDVAGVARWQGGSPLSLATGKDTHLPTVMDFPLMIKSADLAPFKADTDPWNGLNKIYDHLALDYVYADPLKVLRFLDNHDTERVIQHDIDSLQNWKQAITLLLTAPGIPQIYYGTELLMSGTRQGGDGMIRKDVPGGFPGDKTNAFTRAGRTPLQNEAYDYISAVNKWRKGSEAAAKGKMTHFMPDNGLYLYERRSGDDSFVVVMNGRDKEIDVDMSRYSEIIPEGKKYADVITGETVVLRPAGNATVKFAPRETRILTPVNN